MLSTLQPIVSSLIPVSFILFLGWLAGYKNIISSTHSHSLATYVMSFSFPCSLFVLTATSKPSQLLNGPFVLALWLGIMAMFGLSFMLHRFLGRRSQKQAAQSAFVCSFPDMAFMGIPIFSQLFGPPALLAIAIGNIGSSLFLIPTVTAFLSTGQQQAMLPMLTRVLTKPLVLAPVLGTLYALSGWPLPDTAQQALNLIGSSTAGVSLFTLGLIMSGYAIYFTRWVGFNLLLKNIIHPLWMLLLIKAFHVSGLMAKEAVLLCAMPTATMTTMFALKYQVLTEESTSSTILSTLLALLTLPVFMAML